MSGPVMDFDFHPDEDGVRVFTAEPDGVLRFSSDVYVCAARYGDVVLWHYAFAGHWFKINLTTDLAGQIVETGGDEPGSRFAFNCDIATPMRRHCTAVLAVDLFADLLVRADAASYRVCDLDELDEASRNGLILPGEARGAARGLAELAAIVECGDLLAFLSRGLPCWPAAAARRGSHRPRSALAGSAAGSAKPGRLATPRRDAGHGLSAGTITACGRPAGTQAGGCQERPTALLWRKAKFPAVSGGRATKDVPGLEHAADLLKCRVLVGDRAQHERDDGGVEAGVRSRAARWPGRLSP